MLFHLWIFDYDKQCIYFKEFQPGTNAILAPSRAQSRIIENFLPSILRVTSITNTLKEGSMKTFTIAGFYLHVYTHLGYVLALTTLLGNGAELFQNFVGDVLKLASSVTRNTPHFSLITNQYFYSGLQTLVTQLIQDLTSTHTTSPRKAELEMWRYVAKTLGATAEPLEPKKEKYLLLGAGNAGKSSIYHQFFDNWTLKQIEDIRPTVLKEINNYKDDFLEEPLIIYDLGGQEQYRSRHLQDVTLFTNLRCLILVIDIQMDKNIHSIQQYFRQIITMIKNNKENPLISIFFHKFDPDLALNQLMTNVNVWVEWFNQCLEGFYVFYYTTSIKDNTAREALGQTLLFTLPIDLLRSTIRQNLIVKAANSLFPLVEQFNSQQSQIDKEKITTELYRNSIPFGFEATKLLMQEWIQYIQQKKALTTSNDKEMLYNVPKVELSMDPKRQSIKVRIVCSLPIELQNNPTICTITHGLFEGMSRMFGLKGTSLVQCDTQGETTSCTIELQIRV